MTSVVAITAHCSDAKEVHVVVTDAGSLVEELNLANGEKAERYAYDDRVISVKEVVKVDRHAAEVEAAEFSLAQAKLRFEDAASRGFHMNNRDALAADIAARQAELNSLIGPAESPALDPAVAAITETKTYSDGSSATGPGPLPDQSPAQQEVIVIDEQYIRPADLQNAPGLGYI